MLRHTNIQKTVTYSASCRFKVNKHNKQAPWWELFYWCEWWDTVASHPTCLPTQAYGFGTRLRTTLAVPKSCLCSGICMQLLTAAPIDFRFICHWQRSNKLLQNSSQDCFVKRLVPSQGSSPCKIKKDKTYFVSLIFLELVTGLEPATCSLRMSCTTNCATQANL